MGGQIPESPDLSLILFAEGVSVDELLSAIAVADNPSVADVVFQHFDDLGPWRFHDPDFDVRIKLLDGVPRPTHA